MRQLEVQFLWLTHAYNPDWGRGHQKAISRLLCLGFFLPACSRSSSRSWCQPLCLSARFILDNLFPARPVGSMLGLVLLYSLRASAGCVLSSPIILVTHYQDVNLCWFVNWRQHVFYRRRSACYLLTPTIPTGAQAIDKPSPGFLVLDSSLQLALGHPHGPYVSLHVSVPGLSQMTSFPLALWFHVGPRLAVLLAGFRRVSPIQPHRCSYTLWESKHALMCQTRGSMSSTGGTAPLSFYYFFISLF